MPRSRPDAPEGLSPGPRPETDDQPPASTRCEPLMPDRYSRLAASDLERLTARVIDIISYYKPIFGLESWGVYVVAQRLEENKAEVQCWPEYREAEITVNPFQLAHVDETELTETVVHELGHVLVSRFIDDWKHARKAKHRKLLEEGLVSDVTGTILRAERAIDGDPEA